MILIFSSYVEYSTALVINWLNFKKIPFLRLNYLVTQNGIESIDFDIELGENETIFVKKNDKIYDLNKFTSIWFRRLQINDPININLSNEEKIIEEKINVMKFTEKSSLFTYLVHNLKDRSWLNHPRDVYINKPDQLRMAKQFGLQTPDTIITTKKKSLITFKQKHHKVITKAIGNLQPLYLSHEKSHYSFYTTLVTDEKLNEIPNTFYPSLFQEYINKKFEIRSFFIGNKFYHCAMFTQNDKVTEVDFRRFSDNTFTRRIPFKMPQHIEDKMKNLINYYNLNSGSIDSIFTETGEIYFLEINPVGQFGFISYFCNFYIELEIANFLISNIKKYE